MNGVRGAGLIPAPGEGISVLRFQCQQGSCLEARYLHTQTDGKTVYTKTPVRSDSSEGHTKMLANFHVNKQNVLTRCEFIPPNADYGLTRSPCSDIDRATESFLAHRTLNPMKPKIGELVTQIFVRGC